MKKEIKSATLVDRVVIVLLANGWEVDGYTHEQTVRVPTQKSPVFGGMGGELRTLGGRRRFKKDNRRCSVGPRTVCFWVKGPIQNEKFERFKTRDMESIESQSR